MPQRHFTRRSFLKIMGGSAVGTSAATFGSFFYARSIEPGWVEVNPLALTLPHLPAAFDGYRLVHITDLHIDDTWMTAERLGEIVRLVNAQQPDLIAITGDFITFRPDAFGETASAALRGLTASDGVVGVLGNHDHWSDAAISRQVLAAGNVRELSDATLTLRRGRDMLHIAGLDDLWPSVQPLAPLASHQPRLDALTARLPADGAAIMLVHEPDIAEITAATGRFDLQLSGHAHGGQVRVPFWGPLVVPLLAQRFPAGQYQVGSLIQYTGRGLGMVAPQVRFNCRPEITVFTLRSGA